MPLETILIIILVLVLLGVAPLWPYSRSWGPYPSGLAGILLVLLLLFLFLRA
jgi:hypothetical protein